MPFVKHKEGPEQRFYRELYEKQKAENKVTCKEERKPAKIKRNSVDKDFADIEIKKGTLRPLRESLTDEEMRQKRKILKMKLP